MASLEEETLFQMVHDFIESADSPTVPIFSVSPDSSSTLSLSNQSHRYFTKLQEILVSGAEANILGSVFKHMMTRERGDHYDAEQTTSRVKRWLSSRLKIDGYNASLCHTSWLSSLGCTAGEYEYIEVIREGGIRVIVDIEFKPQFEVARPTAAYKKLTDQLPLVFVGREGQLMKIISLLCAAAKQSLKERGLHLPPWRTDTYMLSKWLSVKIRSSNNINGVIVSKLEEEQQRNGSRDRLDGASSGCLSAQLSNMTINCC